MIEGIFNKNGQYYVRKNINGVSLLVKENPLYTLFVEDKDGEYFDIIKKVKMKRLDFRSKLEFNETKKYYDLIKKHNVELKPYYNFLFNDWKENNIPKMKVWYLDIEVIDLNNRKFPEPTNAEAPITHIQIDDDKNVYIFMTKDSPKMRKKYKDVKFFIFDNEYDMLEAFIDFLKKENPSIITAWNGDQFDFPYIYRRLRNLGIDPNRLSPLNDTYYEEEKRGNKIYYRTQINGIFLIDSLEIYKKFTYSDQKSYSLEYTAKLILKEGEGKVSYKQYKSIYDFYEQDYDGFTEYAIKDPIVLKNIMKKTGLMDLSITIAKMTGTNLDKIFGTVHPWTNFLTLIALNEKLVISGSESTDDKPIKGGFVKDPIIGKHNWVASEDANSMYPSIMLSFNISPDTYVNPERLPEELQKIYQYFRDENELKLVENLDKINEILKKYPNYIFAGLGFFENTQKGIIPKIIEKTYYGRKKEKQKMLLLKALKEKV